jgi:membrane protease subunit (stomatin/prohibitin family)
LVGVAARTAVFAGTATAVSGRVSRRQQRKFAEQDQQAYAEQQPQQAYAEPAEPDYAAELEQLAQLKNQGILTDEEFEAKKKQILGI